MSETEVVDEGLPGESDDVAVALALAEAVRVGGRELVGEPRRVRGMVVDALGAKSRTRRAEVDAVVLAAEEGLAEELLAGRMEDDDAMALLAERGLDEVVARFAVDVWRFGLGLLAADADPPSLTNSLEVATDPATSEEVATEVAVAGMVVEDGAAASEGSADDPGGSPADAPEDRLATEAADERRPRSRALAAAVAAAAVLLVVGVAVAVTWGGGEEVAAPDVLSITGGEAVSFEVESTPLGELTRRWEVRDGEFVGSLTFENSSGEELSGRHLEVVPTSVAATADLITSDPEHVVIRENPVIAWDLVVPAAGSVSVTYRVAMDGEVTEDDLAAWQAEQAEKAAAFAEEREAVPELAIGTANGLVVPGGNVEVYGTVTPGSTVSVNERTANVYSDGSWTILATWLSEGANTVSVVASSPAGTTSTGSITITVQPPAPGPETTSPPADGGPSPDPGTRTTVPRDPGTPGTAPPGTAPPGTAPPQTAPPQTAPPQTAPPPISSSISGATWVYIGCTYTYTYNPSGFTPTRVVWTGNVQGPTATVSYNSSGGVGPYTFSATGTAPDGRTSTASITVDVQPPGKGC